MSTFVDAPCPIITARGRTVVAGNLYGTRWLHNPQQRRWYFVKECPECRGIHKPRGVREDRLVIPGDRRGGAA